MLDELYQVLRLANASVKANKTKDARDLYHRAWDMIPEPKYAWDISQITLMRIARGLRDAGYFEEALVYANAIDECKPNPGDADPAILLGSIYYASGDLARARSCFYNAFQIAGKRGFRGENPDYLKLALQRDTQ